MFFASLLVLLLSEWLEVDPTAEDNVSYQEANKVNYQWDVALQIIICVTMLLTFVLSIINFYRKPPTSIFSTFEENLRQALRHYLSTLNVIYMKNGVNLKGGGGLRFEISNNDLLWIEIYVPRHLQMPFSEDEIAKHLMYMTERKMVEMKERPDYRAALRKNSSAIANDATNCQVEPIKLFMAVTDAQEADEHNVLMGM